MFIEPEIIIECLENDFQLSIENLAQLPLGADANAAVYTATTNRSERLFVKVRQGAFDPTSVQLLRFMVQHRSRSIIPVLNTADGRLWATLNRQKEQNEQCLIVYPFVDGYNGYEQPLSAESWGHFGQALRQIHEIRFPADLIQAIRKEDFRTDVCDRVRAYLEPIEGQAFSDPVADELRQILQRRRADILQLVNRVEQLAPKVQAQNLPFVVCHSDLHAGNLLIQPDQTVRIVDWDAPILAPKERDLMYIGGALLASGLTPEEEQAIFYQSYGQATLSQVALAYYRCERIVQDIFEYCKELLDSTDGSAEDRQQSLAYQKANFEPGRTIEAAYQFDFGDVD